MYTMIAVILESEQPERLHTGLSLLVSAASDGLEARGLASFGALPLLIGPTQALVAHAEATSRVPDAARFAHSLGELRDACASLPELQIWACAAAADVHGITEETAMLRLAGICSTPRFLREVAGGELVVA